MNVWGLPKVPELQDPTWRAVHEFVTARIHEDLAALEEVAKLAVRDGKGVVVEHDGGRIIDAHVNDYVAPGRIYYTDVGTLRL